MKFEHWLITINSKGQLMIAATYDDAECVLLKVFDRYGNLLLSLRINLSITESNAYYGRRVLGIASDRANNVFFLTRMRNENGFVMYTVIVFDHQANFQHEFDVKEDARAFRIAVSDHDKVLVLAELQTKKNRVQVYNFNGLLLYSVKIQISSRTVDLTSIDPGGDKILVLGSNFDLLWDVDQSSEQESVLSEYSVISGLISNTRFLHNAEHVATMNSLWDDLCLYKKNGELVRKIELNLSALKDRFTNKESFTMTTQGLVATLTTDNRTGERMIAIL